MTTIRVHRPDVPLGSTEPLELAPRRELGPDARLLVVENRKPRAKFLLTAIAERVRDRLSLGDVEIHSKPSAAAPIDADVTRMLAVRSRLVITGLGD